MDRERRFWKAADIALAPLVPGRGAYGGAALLRPVMALEHPPETNLTGSPILVLNGEGDPFLPHEVREETLPTGHELSRQNEDIVARWLRELGAFRA